MQLLKYIQQTRFENHFDILKMLVSIEKDLNLVSNTTRIVSVGIKEDKHRSINGDD